MYIKCVIFYSLVIYSQGVLSGVNIDSITNAQNKYGKYYIANPNTHNIENPLLLTSQMMPHVSLYENQPPNKIDSVRANLPLNQNLKQQLTINRQSDFLPNEKLVATKYSGGFYQNLHQLGQEFNNFPIQWNINKEDSHKNGHIPEKTFDARNQVQNGDIRSDILNKKEITTLQPMSIPVYKGLQQQKTVFVPKQNKVPTNFGTEIKSNMFRINRQEGKNVQGPDPPLLTKLNENKNKIQRTSKTRYIFVRNNGNIEYYDSLEIILKKYPHLNLRNNVPRLVPNNFKHKHDISFFQKNKQPIVNSPPFNTKTNELVKQYSKVQAEAVQLQKRFKVNNVSNSAIENNNESGQLSYLQVNKRMFENSQESTHLPLKTVIDQGMTIKRPIKEENQKIFNINQNTRYKSNITETFHMEPLTDIPIEKLHTVNVRNFTDISKITDDVKTTVSLADKTGQATATLTTLNNHVNVPYKDNLSNKRTVSKENINGKTEIVTSITDRSNLSDSRVVNKPAPVISNAIVDVHLLNTSKQLTISEKIAIKEEKSNSSSNNQGLNDDQLEPKQANATKSNKAISVINTQDISLDHSTNNPKSEDYEEDNSSESKPVLWVKTTDPDFWKKLVDDNDAYSFIYIINVQSPPKVEREKQKTIHANGTVIEELTETVWEDGHDKPKVRKTVKVTPGAVNE